MNGQKTRVQSDAPIQLVDGRSGRMTVTREFNGPMGEDQILVLIAAHGSRGRVEDLFFRMSWHQLQFLIRSTEQRKV
jgi:hypothetical protein